MLVPVAERPSSPVSTSSVRHLPRPTDLPPVAFVASFRICLRRRENRPQTPQVKEDTYARMWVLSSYSITRPEVRIGGINLYVMIEAFRTY